jgi:hypothetical protein
MKPCKAVIVEAAIAGLRAGSSTVRTYCASTSYGAGVSFRMDDSQKARHSCSHCGASTRYLFTDYRE